MTHEFIEKIVRECPHLCEPLKTAAGAVKKGNIETWKCSKDDCLVQVGAMADAENVLVGSKPIMPQYCKWFTQTE